VGRSDEHLTSVAPFVLFWFVALAWNAYWWLYRIAFSVTVRDDTLAWEAPLPVSRIQEQLPGRTGWRP
jgi:hypothetical protein